MSIQITSTTDSPEAVAAAMGDLANNEEVKTDISESTPNEESDETVKGEESETSEVETEEKEELSEKNEKGDSEDSDSEETKKPKKQGGYKRKIGKLSAKLSDAEREAEYWKSKALADKKESNELAPEKEAAPNDKPSSEEFDTHEEYVEALADWKVEQKLQAHEAKSKEKALKSEYDQKIQAHQKKVMEFAETHDDFQDVMEEVDDIALTLTVQQEILDSDNSAQLMYELAKDPEELERICSLSATAAARAIGRFEARILENSETSTPKKVERKTTKAPAPITPVRSKGSSGSVKNPDDMTFSEFEAWRANN